MKRRIIDSGISVATNAVEKGLKMLLMIRGQDRKCQRRIEARFHFDEGVCCGEDKGAVESDVGEVPTPPKGGVGGELDGNALVP